MMSIELCKTLAATMDNKTLSVGWQILYREHQRREVDVAAKNKRFLLPGMKVEWNNQGTLMTGVVDRIKTKKALVMAHHNGVLSTDQWDIPLGMLTKIS